jgi:hypothetical protein
VVGSTKEPAPLKDMVRSMKELGAIDEGGVMKEL